jgi:hypothetical protein
LNGLESSQDSQLLELLSSPIIAATSWVLKSYLKNFVHELKPNGGGSMKDTVNQIHSEITELRVSVAKLEGQFTQHLAEIGRSE